MLHVDVETEEGGNEVLQDHGIRLHEVADGRGDGREAAGGVAAAVQLILWQEQREDLRKPRAKVWILDVLVATKEHDDEAHELLHAVKLKHLTVFPVSYGQEECEGRCCMRGGRRSAGRNT